MNALARFKYRLALGILGFISCGLNLAILGYVDEGKVFPFTLFMTIHMLLSIPGLLYPLKGTLTLLLVSSFWGVVGYLVGRTFDRRWSRAAPQVE